MPEPTILSIALRVRRWADEQQLAALESSCVPGADSTELRRLAAIGGIVRAIAGDRTDRWPEELAAWCRAAPAPPAALMDDIARALNRDEDVLAAVYERAVTPRHRRQLGTFFTSSALVDHMLDRAEQMLDVAPSVIIDPGAGVGAFSAAAARRWPNARIRAVDVNLVTLGLLGARLATDGLETQVDLLHEDFLTWIASAQAADAAPWLYLGNPPYTRTQALDAGTKARAAELTGDTVSSGHATLSTIFAAAIQGRLRDQDAMCLLLPAAWTHTRSARELREALWKKVWRPLELHRWPTRTRAFVGPDVTATVLALGPTRERRQPYRFARAEVREGSVRLSPLETRSRQAPCPDPWPGGAGRRGGGESSESVPLSEFFRIRRGIATGANRFFFVAHDIAAALPAQIQRAGLLTLRGAHIDDGELDLAAWVRLRDQDHACVLLDIAAPDLADARVAQYIARGEALGLHRRYLCAHSDPWYAIEQIAAPDFIIGPLISSSTHLVRNTVAAVPSNSLYGLYTNEGVQETEIAALEVWLRGPGGLAAIHRHAHRMRGGSLKLEPGSLRTLPVPLTIFAQQESCAAAARVVAR